MPPRSRSTPWIESSISGYGSREEEGSSRGRLKAHVIGVGQMTQSQARGSDGPTGSLFSSDGALQIPAVLTASGWENLQEQEERECFSSLSNASVFSQDYRSQFHMDPEQTRCWFFSSVGESATTSAGPVKENTPCCTSLASVRMKICRTWRSSSGSEGSQRSQGGSDSSESSGEWQDDCSQTSSRDVREKSSVSRGPRPSASAHSPSPSCSNATSWDSDRVRYRGEPSFSIPAKLLIIPEGEVGGRSSTPSVEDAEWQIPEAAGGEAVQAADGKAAGDAGGEEVEKAGSSSPPLSDDIVPLTVTLPSNPWDMFSPPCVSTSDSSPDSTPSLPPSKPDSVAVVTSTQLPVHSLLPPYQNQPASSLPATSSSTSAAVSPSGPPASDGAKTPAVSKSRREDAMRGNYRKPKRKRCDASPEAVEEEEVSGSPPSWLFDSNPGASGNEDGGSPKQAGAVPRKTQSVHSDGRPFSYTYRVSGQNSQDFSQFRVAASSLHWAVRYSLTPRPTEEPQIVE